MINNARGNHSLPGVYTREIDVPYATSTLGITSVGVAGETLKGPAFVPMLIQNWNEYVDYFGGTSAEKFKESNYPKYELPYIAKSYLSQSNQLYVTRVLGLSGYNAGPAWIISAVGSSERSNGMVVAVLRSRGTYQKIARGEGFDICDNPVYEYDKLTYKVKDITLSKYVNVNMIINCDVTADEQEVEFDVNANNYGMFTIKVSMENGVVKEYPVSLNPGTKDYILKVLGSKQNDGDAPLYVEELYDVALQDLILSGEITQISNKIVKYSPTIIKTIGEPALDIINKDSKIMKRSNVGQRFIVDAEGATKNFKFITLDSKTKLPIDFKEKNVEIGHIYTIRPINDNGTRKYVYTEIEGQEEFVGIGITEDNTGQVLVLNYDRYFMGVADETKINFRYHSTFYIKKEGEGFNKFDYNDVEIQPIPGEDLSKEFASGWAKLVNIEAVICDMNNYKEQYRCASTPWFISELKGDGKNPDVNRLFRFHTISDGNDSNTQIKISIENVKPDNGTFDVVVRNYHDNDSSVQPLEKYLNCTMKPGTEGYIGMKIGTFDGTLESKSKYITVELIENDTTKYSVPCGFLGYPIRQYNGLQPDGSKITNVIPPYVAYNEYYDEEVRERKQYFGMSDITGVDVDVLTYKGKNAYGSDMYGCTPGFHLDSTLNKEVNTDINITVDGELGYKFRTVSPNNVTRENKSPIIGSEADMIGTIYEKVNLRKFTVYPFGGFDGWDVYRGYRSNTDDFKATKYAAPINKISGEGTNFSKITNGEVLGLTGNTISSDYYAYLGAIKQFANINDVKINLLATPCIDYVNNQLLVEDVIDIVETERNGDCLYIVTTPDKPFGASDVEGDMYTAQDVVANLEDTRIDSSYVATYYPWIKYNDTENNIYINLPVTKDILRNIALIDDKLFPWYAPAGISRGNVDCTKAHKKLTNPEGDVIYDGKINPVSTDSTVGVKVWGNKTMYSKNTPLNRINVRRLMIRMKDLIINESKKLIFDPNDNTMGSQFESSIKPILENIKSNKGIYDYKIKIDTSVEARDNHELPTKIWVKPEPTLEYIPIDFVITPLGATFTD